MFKNIFAKMEIYGTGHPTLKLKALRDLADILGYVDSYIVVATKEEGTHPRGSSPKAKDKRTWNCLP